MSYSQGEEEAAILQIFGDDPGRFLDIGAYDGKTFSNTLALAEKGWGGVCIEPSPHSMRRLQDTHKDREDIQLACVAVSSGEQGLMKFYDTDDLVGSLDQEHMEKWSTQVKDYREIWVNVINVTTLFQTFPPPFDFINIDVEGKNLYVAKSILDVLEKSDALPRCFCIEHDSHHVELANRGRELGYATRYLDGNNIILAR